MIAKQTVFLNADRTKAVAEGDADAKFLLVREGHEIDDKMAEKYDGAINLIGKAGKAPAERPALDLAGNVPAKPKKSARGKGKK